MIWYACKQCGKRHGKAEHQAGVLVFCECGFGNRVPLASTVPEPEQEESPAPIPLPLPPSSRPTAAVDPAPPRDDNEPRPRSDEPLPPFRPKPRREYRRVNPKFCLNHDELPTEFTCAHCHLPFCSKCVLDLQGEKLCGPCKNFKVRGMQRPNRLSPLATGAAVVGLVAGPISFCLSWMGAGQQAAIPRRSSSASWRCCRRWRDVTQSLGDDGDRIEAPYRRSWPGDDGDRGRYPWYPVECNGYMVCSSS